MGRVVTRSHKCSSSYNDDSESSKVLLNQDMMLPILTLLPLNCLLNSARIVDSCNGILFMLRWSWFAPAKTQTFLVNPLIKSRLKLPRLPYSHHYRTHPAVQFTIVCLPHTAKFKLFFIDILEVSGALYYVFYVLRLGIDNSWKEILRKEAPKDWDTIWKPLFDGGYHLYWISTQHGVTVLDVDKEITVGKFSLPPLPAVDPYRFTTFLWRGNQLTCIVSIVLHETYQISILDFDSGKWSLYHEMGPFDFVAACGRELIINFLLFRYWIHDQIIFRVASSPEIFPRGRYSIHFSYNVNTRQVTKIEGIDIGNHEVWLHTNSLFSLPSTPT